MRILFINSVCSRNGSTLMLLYFLEWLNKKCPTYKIDVISVTGGTLVKEFDKVADKHYKPFVQKNIFYKIIRGTLRKLKLIKIDSGLFYDYEINKIIKNQYDLIYNNTIFNIKFSNYLKNICQNTKLIVHTHEMENFIKSVYSDFDKISIQVDWFICASNAVKKDLFKNWNIQNSNVIYELSKFETKNSKKKINNDIVVISGSGRGAHRKGLDLFIKTCKNLLLKSNGTINFKFQWLGYLTIDEKTLHENIVKEHNLESYFSFLDEREDTSSYFTETNIFIMSSREDPFPLVCIEAANYGIPIFLFNKTTGTQEVFEDLNYLIAQQFDTNELAEKIISLLNNEELYCKTSELLVNRFSQFTVENQSEQILKKIKEVTEK